MDECSFAVFFDGNADYAVKVTESRRTSAGNNAYYAPVLWCICLALPPANLAVRGTFGRPD